MSRTYDDDNDNITTNTHSNNSNWGNEHRKNDIKCSEKDQMITKASTF